MILIVGGHAQGMKEYAAERFGKDRTILDDINSLIREALKNGEDPGEKLRETLETCPDAVVISELIGCGIVPLSPEEREFREVVGRCQIRLAKEAEEVVRVICGIGQKIK